MDIPMGVSMAKGEIAVPRNLYFPIEVWVMIGETITSQSTLIALVSTCRTFFDLFTPFLRRKFAFELIATDPSDLLRKPLPRSLRHTQEFEVLLEELNGKTYTKALHDNYASVVIRMLKKMTSLQSFRWIDSTFDDTYRPSTMLRNKKLLRLLKQSSTLKNISIIFASQYLDGERDASRCFFSLNGFQNLTSLELYNFYGEPDDLVVHIVQTLARCPGLKTLGLSFACEFDCYDSPEVLIYGEERQFFERLCVEYGARTELHPLQLETLRLGHGVYLFDAVYSSTNMYLAEMVKLENLRNLYIANGLAKWDLEDESESIEVDWDQLGDCKALHRLSVSRLETNLVQWLKKGHGSKVEELIVTDHYGMYDDELDNFELLRLPRLSMLFIREMTVDERSGDDAWSDTDSSATETSEAESTLEEEPKLEADDPSDLEISLSPRTPTRVDSPSPTMNSDLEAVSETRRMRVDLARPVVSVLDRLYNYGAQLTRLGLCLNLETQWAQFSTHLPRLRQLTHLRLDPKSHRSGQYPTKASSLWPGVEASQDIAHRYALLIHSKCLSLKYIQIRYYSWRVAYRRDFGATSHEPTEWVELQPLDRDEIESIELFALQNFCSETGLPSTERPDTPSSDEDLNRVYESFYPDSKKTDAA